MASRKNSGGDRSSSLRRSGRQKKLTYDTLNQTWLCSRYEPELMPIRRRDVRNSDPSSSTGCRSNRIAKEVIALKEHRRRDFEEDEETFDVYERVKRRHSSIPTRSQTVAVYRGTESHEDSNQSIIENSSHIVVQSKDWTPPKVAKHRNRLDSESSVVDTDDEPLDRRYELRQHKPVPQRLEIEFATRNSRERGKREATGEFERTAFTSPAHKRVKRDFLRQNRVRKLENESLSSTSDSSDDTDEDDRQPVDEERKFERRKMKSMERARRNFLPMNQSPKKTLSVLHKEKTNKTTCADLDPMSIDNAIGFDQIGGLSSNVHSLKEMILFPLMYPEVFDKFKITPPRGVLFYGPPGTGKTLVARALCNECSKNERKVSFFMRKGADCMSKWVGESERQLRLLFDQAYSMRPSIIFFDEIDGLAPVRSSRQDQIHSSIVSTLLALMDGLDQRGEVIVIGATNRLDSLDPALRRPGRFDRELRFSLPDINARKEIFKIHTLEWSPTLADETLNDLAERSVGYCGADIKGLCTEAALISLRKRYPQIYASDKKLVLDTECLSVSLDDFLIGMRRLVPAVSRGLGPPTRKIPKHLNSLLDGRLTEIMKKVSKEFQRVDSSSVDHSIRSLLNDLEKKNLPLSQRILIFGDGAEHGQTNHLAPAVFHNLDHLPVFSLSIPHIFSSSHRSPEEAVAEILSNAAKSCPCVLYLPILESWASVVSESVWFSFTSILDSWHNNVSVLMLITSHQNFNDLDPMLQAMLDKDLIIECSTPNREERTKFFEPLIFEELLKPLKNIIEPVFEKLEIAPPPEPQPLTEVEMKNFVKKGKSVLRQLRIFLREILSRLIRDRRFTAFLKPVDRQLAPDYDEIIQTPMDLSKMMNKIDGHQYENVEEFLSDIELITRNALEYNPDKELSDKLIRHRACTLFDIAKALIDDELDSDFEEHCQEMKKFRETRNIDPIDAPPAFIRVAPISSRTRQEHSSATDMKDISMQKNKGTTKPAKNLTIKAASIVKKYRAKRHLELSSKPTVNDSANVIDITADSHRSASASAHSSPSKQSKNEPVENCFLETEAATDEDCEFVIKDEGKPFLYADNPKLVKLLDLLVDKTDGCSVGYLEKLYSSILSEITEVKDDCIDSPNNALSRLKKFIVKTTTKTEDETSSP